MGTTPNRAYPYPDAADPFALGNEQIQALAEAVDETLEERYAKLARVTAGQSIPDTTGVIIQWNSGDSTLTTDFDLVTDSATDDTIKYLGPPMFGIFQIILEWPVGLFANTAFVELKRNDVTPTLGTDRYFHFERDFAVLGSGIPVSANALIWLETNAEWQATVWHDTGATRSLKSRMNIKALP